MQGAGLLNNHLATLHATWKGNIYHTNCSCTHISRKCVYCDSWKGEKTNKPSLSRIKIYSEYSRIFSRDTIDKSIVLLVNLRWEYGSVYSVEHPRRYSATLGATAFYWATGTSLYCCFFLFFLHLRVREKRRKDCSPTAAVLVSDYLGRW